MYDPNQLKKWLEGESTHDKAGDCCPDFSCCVPALLWPKEKREKFAAAVRDGHEREMCSMLLEALKALAEHEAGKHKVAVIG